MKNISRTALREFGSLSVEPKEKAKKNKYILTLQGIVSERKEKNIWSHFDAVGVHIQQVIKRESDGRKHWQ